MIMQSSTSRQLDAQALQQLLQFCWLDLVLHRERSKTGRRHILPWQHRLTDTVTSLLHIL